MKILNYLRNEIARPILPMIASGLTAILLVGCKEIKEEVTEILHEEAIVTYKQSESGRNNLIAGMVVGRALDKPSQGLALGIATSKKKRNYITFTCKKANITLDDKNLFNRFNTNDVVDIFYQERYLSTYEDTNGDGKKELIGRVELSSRFLDILPKR